MTSEPTWGWVDWISNWCILHAACTAPASLAARLEEEWLATASEIQGPLCRLRFALGCWYAVPTIAREHTEPALVAPAAAPRHRRFVRLPKDEFPLLTVNTATFLLIVTLYAALLYGLALGLSPRSHSRIAGPRQSTVVEQMQVANRETQL